MSVFSVQCERTRPVLIKPLSCPPVTTQCDISGGSRSLLRTCSVCELQSNEGSDALENLPRTSFPSLNIFFLLCNDLN